MSGKRRNGNLWIVGFLACGLFLGAANIVSETARAGTWTIEIVDATDEVGEYTSLALDSNGYPHIAYFDHTHGGLKYARWNGLTWTIETVYAAGPAGPYSSLALNKSDYARISYFNWGNRALGFVKQTESGWVAETIDAIGDYPSFTSLALDGNDYGHISYYESEGVYGHLKYAAWNGSDWEVEVVDTLGAGEYSSIVLDGGGSAHISYYGSTGLKYARQYGDDWSIQYIDSDGNVGSYTSIALSGGVVHISYQDSDFGDLKYAKFTGRWTIETVDSADDVGRYSSVAVDTKGSAYISYLDDTNDGLKLARQTGGGWVTETIDKLNDIGKFSSIAIDADDYTHISYWDETNCDLKYAKGLPNNLPEKPLTPSGPASGVRGVSYTYSTSAIDPDGDQIKYFFDWGDGTQSETAFTDSGASSGKTHKWNYSGTYLVKAMAVDPHEGRSTWSDSLIVSMIGLPYAPTGLTAIPGDGRITLSWKAPQNNGGSPITMYKIYRTTSFSYEKYVVEIGNITTYEESGLTNGQEYHYKVSAVNSLGEGPQSGVVDATPAAPLWPWLVIPTVIAIVVGVIILGWMRRGKPAHVQTRPEQSTSQPRKVG